MVFDTKPFKSLVNSFSFDKFTFVVYNLKVPANNFSGVLRILFLHEIEIIDKTVTFDGDIILTLQITKHV